MYNLSILLYSVAIVVFLVSCQSSKHGQNDANTREPATSAIKVIFDTDMGSDCDDVGALALLHQYANEGKADIIACIYSSGKIPYGAGVIDAINHYYHRPNLPIGAAHDTLIGDPVDKMGAEKLAKDTLRYHHNIIHNADTEEQTMLNRSLLAKQANNSIVYITVGHTNGLYELLTSKPDRISPLSGATLISKKVKHWVALGALKANNPKNELKKDWNFFFNGTASSTEYLVKNFPKPIYFIDGGSNTMTGQSLENTLEGNIVRQAYTDWLQWYGGKTLQEQRPSWDLVTVYFAIEGLGNFLKEAESGWLDFDAEKGCIWKGEDNTFQHHFIFQKPDTDSLFAKELNQKIAASPIK